MDFSGLKKLEAALFVYSEKIELTEPHDFAAGIISKKVRHLQRQWQYCKEIIRIKKELELTIELAKSPCNEQILQSLEIYPEESVLYYHVSF